MTLKRNIKVFMVHISSLKAKMIIYLAKNAQILLLLIKNNIILAKHSDFANVFLNKSIKVLLK